MNLVGLIFLTFILSSLMQNDDLLWAFTKLVFANKQSMAQSFRWLHTKSMSERKVKKEKPSMKKTQFQYIIK